MSLTKQQKDELRRLLENLCKETAEQVQQLEESSRPVSLDESIGRLSRMDAINQQNMALAAFESAKQRLTMLQAALTRLDDEEVYGICLLCKKPISWERLKAKPEALACIKCAR